jgi:glucose-1-phosphate thymidylyltransferase
MYKGIILAGGSGTRLFPATMATSKQLLPIYDKPMVYYPLSVLMMAEIRDILIITTPQDHDAFERLLGDGNRFGVNLTYAVQPKPEGLAQAFLIANEVGFLTGKKPCALVLGDNIFHGAGFKDFLIEARERSEADLVLNGDATVFGYYVNDPNRYGIAEFDEEGKCLSIEEKPKEPKSNYAVVGLYFYPSDVVERAKMVKPSRRGELEITSINQMYLAEGRLQVEKLPRGYAWLDTGTFDSLYQASSYVEAVEKRQGLQIACLEEIAYNNEWIDEEDLFRTAEEMGKSEYGQYLKSIIDRK